MSRIVISNHLAVLHYEAHALQFVNVGDGIPRNCNNVCKLPKFNRSQHQISTNPTPPGGDRNEKILDVQLPPIVDGDG